jgi:hypothetical protein
MRFGTTVRKLSTSANRNVVLVDGCRIPFTQAGTNYKDYLAVDLARMAMKGLLCKTALDAEKVSDVVFLFAILMNVTFRLITFSMEPQLWKQKPAISHVRQQWVLAFH